MAVIENARSTLEIAKIKAVRLPLNVNAGTYDIFTAQGDVFCEVLAAYVYVAGAGFTSISIQTNHTTPKTILASTPVASVTKDAAAPLGAGVLFVLPDGKKITGTVVGNGSAGEVILVVRSSPITQGATLI